MSLSNITEVTTTLIPVIIDTCCLFLTRAVCVLLIFFFCLVLGVWSPSMLPCVTDWNLLDYSNKHTTINFFFAVQMYKCMISSLAIWIKILWLLLYIHLWLFSHSFWGLNRRKKRNNFDFMVNTEKFSRMVYSLTLCYQREFLLLSLCRA
jgi:hypothetical protein